MNEEQPNSGAAQPDSCEYRINGYSVYFPEGRKPFAAQLSVISKVLQALKESHNALLESPTGTGKTLALLSSTLAYQATFANSFRAAAAAAAGNSHNLGSLHGSGNVHASGKGVKIEKASISDENIAPPQASAHSPQAPVAQVAIKVPKVFYCTRTHSQLQQIVDEFRNCHPVYAENANMCVLGSRAHLCINGEAKREAAAGKALNEVCQVLRDDHKCSYMKKQRRVDATASELSRMKIWDIEDAIEVGTKMRGCPYYATRAVFEQATYVLCPYNYILDPSIRKSMQISLKNAIVVFDEAHNIEDIARDAASLELTKSIIVTAMAELNKLIDRCFTYCDRLLELCSNLLRWMDEMAETLSNEAAAAGGQDAAHTPVHKGNSSYRPMHAKKQALEDHECVWDGEEFLHIFESRFSLNLTTLNMYQQTLDRLIEEQEKAKEEKNKRDPEERAEHADASPVISSQSISFLRKYLLILEFMWRNQQAHALDFRIVIQKIDTDALPATKAVTSSSRRKSSASSDVQIIDSSSLAVSLHFWCMNAAVVFEDIVSATKSIILTSGTLSPLDTFAAELGTVFPVKLEANHVINLSKQLYAGCYSSFYEHSLNSTYQHQQSDGYLDMIGQILFMLMKLTPGGVLMFVPSYRLLQRLQYRWQSTGLLTEVADTLHSKIFFEVKNNNNMNQQLEDYYQELSTVDSKAGLVAVCRGKVSEGINFSDHYARTVVIVGIPFPALFDLQVHLKKKFQDQRYQRLAAQAASAGAHQPAGSALSDRQQSAPQSANTQSTSFSYSTPYKKASTAPSYPTPNTSTSSATASATAPPCLDGNMWYKQQAFRAINQAIGRCIRHRNDFGAIILLDPRFYQDNVVQHLSRWMRQDTRCYDRVEDSILGIKQFFQQHDSYATIQAGVVKKAGRKRGTEPKAEEKTSKDKKKRRSKDKDTNSVDKEATQGEVSKEQAISYIFGRMINEMQQKKEKELQDAGNALGESIDDTSEEEEEEEVEIDFELDYIGDKQEDPLARLQPPPGSRAELLGQLRLAWSLQYDRSPCELPVALSQLHALFAEGTYVTLDTKHPRSTTNTHPYSASYSLHGAGDGVVLASKLVGNSEERFPWTKDPSMELKACLAASMGSKELAICEEWSPVDRLVYQLVFVRIASDAKSSSSPFSSPYVSMREQIRFQLLAVKVIATGAAQSAMLYACYLNPALMQESSAACVSSAKCGSCTSSGCHR